MTQAEIIEMAKQAGLEEAYSLEHNQVLVRYKDGALEAFAKLVASAAIAKERLDCFDAAYQAYATAEVLKAIRARGEA